MFSTLSEFYISKEWRSFRQMLIAQRTKSDGILCDEFNGKPLANAYDIVLHHIKPLTLQNVNDYSVSLNPANIMIVSHSSHNELHSRFGYCTQRKIYLVHGSPCSGKTSFVKQNKGNSDFVIDSDDIWQMITGGERYCKPNALKKNFFEVRNCMLDMVKRQVGNWERAWIIEAAPFKTPREEKVKLYGAELIHIDTDRTECLYRLANDTSRKHVQTEWARYIEDYFKAYQE